MAGKRDTEREKIMEDLPRKSMGSGIVSAGATKQPGKQGFLPWEFLESNSSCWNAGPGLNWLSGKS